MARRPRRTCAKYGQKYHSAPAATMAHCLRTLAGYLTPPQTYELCQTAKAFHVKENGVPRATRALRVSLEQSLARVLKARGVSVAAFDFKALVDTEGRPGALIAGSTMVQCVLGTVWYGYEDRASPDSLGPWADASSAEARGIYKIDVDVFTTASAAPAVRSQLCGSGLTLSCVGLEGDGGYLDNGNGMTGKSLECHVHHTEGYSLTPEEGYAYEYDSDDPERVEFSLAQATAWASGATESLHRHTGFMPTEREGMYTYLRDWDAPEYRIRGATAAFNYDWRLEGSKLVDLVVARTDVADARDLLASCDLDICKSSFDGQVFRIIDPHRAFRGETRLDPQRSKLMAAFADKLLEKDPERSTYEPQETWDAICHVLNTQEEGHPDWDQDFVPSWETDWGSPETMYHHNWFAKLFLRQEKYRERGVLIDAPPNFVTVAERTGVECIWRGA